MAKDAGLNDKTPKWFQEWHYKHFTQVRDRSKRNERLIYAAIAIILAAGVLSGNSVNGLIALVKQVCGTG